MIRARALILLAAFAIPAAAGPLDLDAGLRGAIFDDNYKLGLGAELGLIQNLGPRFDLGVHLNYTRYRAKTVDWSDADEFGGYATAYLIPALADQPFEMRFGPHAGGATIDGEWYLDVGADVMAIFRVAEKTRVYGAFVPSLLIGGESQGLFRVGLGVQYRLGDGAAAPTTGYEDVAP